MSVHLSLCLTVRLFFYYISNISNKRERIFCLSIKLVSFFFFTKSATTEIQPSSWRGYADVENANNNDYSENNNTIQTSSMKPGSVQNGNISINEDYEDVQNICQAPKDVTYKG